MATPYTSGKAGSNSGGGHTSRGVSPKEHGAKSSGGAKSKNVNRTGSLKSRTISQGKP